MLVLGTASSPTRISADEHEEVVVELEQLGKYAPGKFFATVNLVCAPVMDLKWNWSAPCGIQDVRQTLGTEAAQVVLHSGSSLQSRAWEPYFMFIIFSRSLALRHIRAMPLASSTQGTDNLSVAYTFLARCFSGLLKGLQ